MLAIFLLLGFDICPALHASTLDSSIICMFAPQVPDPFAREVKFQLTDPGTSAGESPHRDRTILEGWF